MSKHYTKRKAPNWKGRPYKGIVRKKIAHEVKTFAAPKDLHCLHLPGESLQCILNFEAAKLPVTTYYGVEQNPAIHQIIKENLQAHPSLKPKVKLIEAEINDILQTSQDKKSTRKRYLCGATKGWDCVYLDFTGGFRQSTKTTFCLLFTNPKTFARAHRKGQPGLLFITLSYRGDLLNKSDLHTLLTLAGPKDKNTPKEEHKAFYHRQIAGIETYLRQQANLEGMGIEATHRIVYKDQDPGETRPVIMLAMGFKVFKKPQKTKKQPPTLFLGIEKCANDLNTLRSLIQWKKGNILTDKEIPGMTQWQTVTTGLLQQGISIKKITRAYQEASQNITENEVKALKTPKPLKGTEPWDEEDCQNLHNALLDSLTLQEVAHRLDRSIGDIEAQCQKLDIPSSPALYLTRFPGSIATPAKETLRVLLAANKAVITLKNPETLPVLKDIHDGLTKLAGFWPKDCRGALNKNQKVTHLLTERKRLKTSYMEVEHEIHLLGKQIQAK